MTVVDWLEQSPYRKMALVPYKCLDLSELSQHAVIALAWVFPGCFHFLLNSRKHIRLD